MELVVVSIVKALVNGHILVMENLLKSHVQIVMELVFANGAEERASDKNNLKFGKTFDS